ncbi:MAG: hypothetical protein V7603_1625, partial [Micromonosporaceae bacterium]
LETLNAAAQAAPSLCDSYGGAAMRAARHGNIRMST